MLIPLVSVLWMHALGPLLVDASHATRDNVGCGFHLSCSGQAMAMNASAIGEKDSGQAHAGSDVVTPSLFTWFGDAFADQAGSGCWWTPPTFTLQCDKNQPPDHGFQIGCDGAVSFNGQYVFYECPTGEGDEVNLYLRPVGDQCHEITIHADNCAPSTCPGGGGTGPGGPNSHPSSSVPPSQGTTPPAAGSSGTSTTGTSPSPSPNSPPGGPLPSSSSSPVPTTLLSSFTTNTNPQGPPPTISPFTTGGDQTSKTSITSTSTITTTVPPGDGGGNGSSASGSSTSASTAPSSTSYYCTEVSPDQIILTDLGNPDTAYGPNDGMHIQVSPNASSIFNFRFGDADKGRTCQLSFRLTAPPPGSSDSNTPYNLTGTGVVALEILEGWADANTTYNSMPRTVQTLDDTLLFVGINHYFPTFPCPGSAARAAVLLGEGPLADTCLDFVHGGGAGLFLKKC